MRNIKKQEKFKKRRQDWNKHYSVFYSVIIYDKNNGSHVYTVDVLPSAKAWRPMVDPVSAYV